MPSEKDKQSPDWREFEKLVARVEGALLKHGATVKSPDRIRSLLTNRLREVDASIRTKIGSTYFLITLECRKRRARQDSTRLEQLGSTKSAIGAAKTVAVSTSPFSSDALQVAKHYGIDIRSIREITDEEIDSWLFPQSVIHMYKHCDLRGPPNIECEMQEGESPEQFQRSMPSGVNDQIFTNTKGDKLNFNDVWNIAERNLGVYDKVPATGETLVSKIKINVVDDLFVKTPIGLRAVRRIEFECALSWKREETPLSQAKMIEYRNIDNSEDSVIRRAEFETSGASKNNIRFGVQSVDGEYRLN